jgi:hypothetical protein
MGGMLGPLLLFQNSLTAKEGPVSIKYKCLLPIYVFPEMKLCSLLISKPKINVLSPNSYTHISVRDLYISRIGLLVYFAAANYVDCSWKFINRSPTHDEIPFLGMHKLDFSYSAGAGYPGVFPRSFQFSS